MTAVEKIVSSTAVRPKRFRFDEFRRMTEAEILPEESGWEIIDGFLTDKDTIGSRHAGIIKRLNRIFSVMFGERVIVSIQDPLHIDDYNEPEPDIALLKPRRDFYYEGHPTSTDVLLLIEISDSAITFDRKIKLNLYAEAGVVDVWLVNLEDESVEQYATPMNGRFVSMTTLRRGEAVNAHTLEGLSLNVDEILGS